MMKTVFYKIIALALVTGMILTMSFNPLTGFADTTEAVDLSVLSDMTESTAETAENYSYIWTVEDSEKTLELTLDGADIQTLTLPSVDIYGILNIIINTQSDSQIGEIYESGQWSSITFSGSGELNIEYMNIQGASNNHMITVSEEANVNIFGEYAVLSFGASGSSNSTLNVFGNLSINGKIICGNLKIGSQAKVYGKRITLSGFGADDMDEYKNAFVLEEGGELELTGNAEEYDDETGEPYAAFVIIISYSDEEAEEIFVVPEGYLPDGYELYKVDGYLTIDDADDKAPCATSFEYGVIYAAKSITLKYISVPVFTVIWKNYNGDILETDENVEYGATPTYDGEVPVKVDDSGNTYTFVGWDSDIEPVTGEVTYTAVFKTEENTTSPESFVVEFETNGGTETEAREVAHGEKLIKPEDPARSGYTFAGWYTEAELINGYDFENEVTSDLILYAKWQKKQSSGGGGGAAPRYSVKFKIDENTIVKEVKVTRSTKLSRPEDPQKEGYIFDGWYTEESCENLYDFERKVTSGFTLYAKWRKVSVSDVLNVSDHFAYVNGYPDNTVRPENYITRAETTEIFFRLLNKDVRTENIMNENSFYDTDKDEWYNESLSTMTGLGIVKGKPDNVFLPDDFITRAEFAAICARFDDSEFEIKDEFADVSGHWAEKEIYEAAAHGWIKGYENGTFCPDEFITRAEAVTMINRMLGRIPGTKEDLNEDMIHWSDNSDESKWYYIAIQEATNSHDYITNDNGERWTSVKNNLK